MPAPRGGGRVQRGGGQGFWGRHHKGPSSSTLVSVAQQKGSRLGQVHWVGLARGQGVGRGSRSPSFSLCRDAQGVYQLATLLMELDAEDEASRLLAADALYRLGRLDEAHKALLVALSRRPQAAPVLVRLALLQLRRGFFYDANQVRSVAPRSVPHNPDLGADRSSPSPGSATSGGRSVASLTPRLLVCALVLRVVVGIRWSSCPRPQQASSMRQALRIREGFLLGRGQEGVSRGRCRARGPKLCARQRPPSPLTWVGRLASPRWAVQVGGQDALGPVSTASGRQGHHRVSLGGAALNFKVTSTCGLPRPECALVSGLRFLRLP